MKFFFEKWRQKRHIDSFKNIDYYTYSTHFTVDGIPFFAEFASFHFDIFIYREPEHVEFATVPKPRSNDTRHATLFIKNHFEDAVALADLIRNEKLKRTEEAQ